MDIIYETKDQIILGNNKSDIFLKYLIGFFSLTVAGIITITLGLTVFTQDITDNRDIIIMFLVLGVIYVTINIYVLFFYDAVVTINRSPGRIIIEEESIIKHLFNPREIPFSGIKEFTMKYTDYGGQGRWDLNLITNNNRSKRIFYTEVERSMREVADKISDLTGKVTLEENAPGGTEH